MEIQLWKHISCSPSLVGQWPQNPRVTLIEQWSHTQNGGRIIEQQSCPRTQESHQRTEQSSRVAPEPSSHSTLLKRCKSKARERIYMRNSGGKVDHISRHTTPPLNPSTNQTEKTPLPNSGSSPQLLFRNNYKVNEMLSFTLFCDFENQKKGSAAFSAKTPIHLQTFKWRQ